MFADMHCDTILKIYHHRRNISEYNSDCHVDLPRLQKGRVDLQFFAIFPDIDTAPAGALTRTLQLLDFFWEQYNCNDKDLHLILSRTDLDFCLKSGKIGALLSVEGGEALAGELSILRILYRLGVRSLGLTWNYRNQLADGAEEGRTGGGLSRFGVEVVREMNRLGMVVDVAHLSERGFWDVLEVSTKPVIASHSNCRALWNHPRNLSDEQISSLAQGGGIIGLTFVADFLGSGRVDLEDYLRQIDHICDLVGDEHLGLGSDFDGTDQVLPEIPDVSRYPVIAEALAQRGYSDDSIRRICRDNCLRVLREIL